MNTTIQRPKIELKSVKTFRGNEGYGLNATLYVDGVKTAFVIDDANGGDIDYEIFNNEKFELLQAYAKTLPAEPIVFNGKTMMTKTADGTETPVLFQPTIDTLVDEVFNEMEKAKAAKKLEKKMDQYVMWGVPGANSHTEVKFTIPLAQIPTAKLQACINKYMATFKPGEQFLNTNLNELGLITRPFNMKDVVSTGEWCVIPQEGKWLVLRNHDTLSAPASDAADQSQCSGLRHEVQGEYNSKGEANAVLKKIQDAVIKSSAKQPSL